MLSPSVCLLPNNLKTTMFRSIVYAPLLQTQSGVPKPPVPCVSVDRLKTTLRLHSWAYPTSMLEILASLNARQVSYHEPCQEPVK